MEWKKYFIKNIYHIYPKLLDKYVRVKKKKKYDQGLHCLPVTVAI